MRKLYLFNPDTDYALASGSDFYTPTRLVREIIRRMTLYPALWAEEGGIILSDISPEEALHEAPGSVLRMIGDKGLEVTDWKHVGTYLRGEEVILEPWGWNQVLSRKLRSAGVRSGKAPTDDFERRLYEASRERTVSLNQFMAERIPEFRIPIPVVCRSMDEVRAFIEEYGNGCLKDPWSSSGRGVLFSEGLTGIQIEQWVGGVIKRHGLVVAETVADRKSDFASLWKITEKGAQYIGLSMFLTSERGRYQNQIVPDKAGIEFMKNKLEVVIDNSVFDRIIEIQKAWLSQNSRISGYASIDMLEEHDGNIRPGIEINRRMTMGVAALLISHNTPEDLPLPSPFIRL